MHQNITFIGGGNMARSLIGGLIARGTPREAIVFSEPNPELRNALANELDVRGESDNTVAARDASVLVLAVKPQVMKTVCEPLAEVVKRNQALVISIAAGIPIAAFESWFGNESAIVRAMPNTPAMIGAGATGLFANARVSNEQRAQAESILQACGITAWIEREALMDAVTALSGSGPAYFFLMMESMIAAGIAQGLAPEVASKLALQTAFGAARMAIESPETPDVLRQRVTSPNGTTAAALDVFEAGGYRELVDRAIARATERGRELAQQFGA